MKRTTGARSAPRDTADARSAPGGTAGARSAPGDPASRRSYQARSRWLVTAVLLWAGVTVGMTVLWAQAGTRAPQTTGAKPAVAAPAPAPRAPSAPAATVKTAASTTAAEAAKHRAWVKQ